MGDKKYLNIFLRYFILILVAIPNLWLFYFIFTPLTVYPLYFLFNLFFETTLSGNIINLSDCFPIEIIKACVAGSAYYLLLTLNLATPNIKIKRRIKMILISFLSLLLINIIRIFVLGLMYVSGSALFDTLHKVFWYAGSTLFVIIIWFAQVKAFKIKEIPFYSDLKLLFKESRKKVKPKNKARNN